MCKPEISTFEEYKEFCLDSLEPGTPLYCEDYIFDKLVSDGKVICILGHKCTEDKTYLVASFCRESSKYVRDLVEWGNVYLDFISIGPLEVIVEKGNKVFERFATFFGFKKTLAQRRTNGVKYNIYKRAS